MKCYRDGGCGIYEGYSCSECPASKPEYANKKFANDSAEKIYVMLLKSKERLFRMKMDKIRELTKRLNEYRDAYYNHNESLISDKEYDCLYDELVELENETGIILSNSPTQTVGFESVSQLQKVKHNHPLLSLGKTTDINEFSKYFQKRPCVVMAKLDGLTCSLLYEKGELVRAESRGNGEIGEDITHNVKMFSNIPLKIPIDGTVVVDGECIITFDEFDRINQRENTEYKNPRNLVSGTVRQLNNEIVKNRNVLFIAWKLHSITFSNGREEKLTSLFGCFSLLSRIGFVVVPHYYLNSGTPEEYRAVINLIETECNKQKIPIDGAVGMFDDIQYGISLGSTGHHPKHSLAFKFYQEDNETTLTEIEWSTSRTGLVNPVAVFDPVEIDGTTVTRATLNNVSIIKELELGIGDTITVIKANQIIPKITQNLTRSNTYQIPTRCPVCNGELEIRNDNGREMLYCTNKHCAAVIHDKIANFASRDGMNIVGISEERLRSLMDMGFITDFISLFHLHEHRDEIASSKGWGESSIDSLLRAIEDSRKCKLQNVIVAIGVPGIGKSSAKSISEHLQSEFTWQPPEFRDYLGCFVRLAEIDYDWTIIPGFGKATSDGINQYLKDNYYELNHLSKYLLIEEDSTKASNDLCGKTFCITGKLERFENRNSLVKDIEDRGGKAVSGVTAKTDYLITNDKTSGSSKNKAAEKFGTKIITEAEYIEGLF